MNSAEMLEQLPGFFETYINGMSPLCELGFGCRDVYFV